MLLNFALQYLAKGWSIIPLEPKGKKPLIDWSEYSKRLPTQQEVTEWFTTNPTANVGIVTGAVSGIAVVDIDGTVGESSVEKLNLPNTVSVKSGRGRHLYYRHPGTHVKNCSNIPGCEKVDIRGDGGYVVAPYSVHENGNIYAWVGGFEALQSSLTAFPTNVLDLLSSNKSANGTGFTEVASQEPWVSELLKGVADGEKHKACIRLAAYFNSKGLPIDVTRSLLLDWNTRNATPAEPSGIIERVEDVYKRYSAGPSIRGGNDNKQGAHTTSTSITTARNAYAGFKEELTKGAKTISTGFPSLDRYSRGLLIGNLSVIGAWPGVGKTAFTLGLARMLAEAGNSVLYFPTEMATNELMRVFVSSGLSIPFQRVMSGNLSEEEHALAHDYLTGEKLANLHIEPITSPSLEDVERAVKQARPNVFMLDYLQHTTGNTSDKRRDISELVMGLKDIAKRYECAGVVTSQFHRPYKGEGGELVPPTMFDFAECGQIEREVSLALLMYPVEKERFSESMEFPVNFILAKNRFGKVCEFQLKFDQQHVRFSE